MDNIATVENLVGRLRTMQEKADKLATEQHQLKQQLAVAVEKVHEMHQKILEERNDIGGEG